MNDYRIGVIEVARSEIGPQRQGSPRVTAYWRNVLPESWTDPQVAIYAKTKAWCGGFALFCYRRVGLTSQHWVDAIGFAGPCHLQRTKTPQRGDLGVKEHPFQHHVLLDYIDPDGWAHCIAGNCPDVREQRHRASEIDWYSIESLIPLPEAGFVRDSSYSVPGIQDEEDTKPDHKV